jgi:hypothetical protein
MFQLPTVIANVIAATRIYRSLVNYSLRSPDKYYCILRLLSSPVLIIVGGSFYSSLDGAFSKRGTKASRMKWNKPAPISLNQIEIAVNTANERYPGSRTTLSMDAQQGDKPHELSVGSDLPVECDIKTGIGKQRP